MADQTGSKKKPTVTFDMDPVITGYTKLPNINPIKKTVTATITPDNEDADLIEFWSSATNRATVGEQGNRVHKDNKVIVTLDVYGVTASPPGNDDCQLQAVDTGDSNKVLSSVKIRVVIPKSQSHAAAAGLKIMNSGVQNNGNKTAFRSELRGSITITIKDQNNALLDSCYDGACVQEKFDPPSTNPGGGPPPQNWAFLTTFIGAPAKMTGGVVQDDCSCFTGYPNPYGPPALDNTQWAAWQAGTFTVPAPFNGDNTFQFPLIPKGFGFVALQKIRVHGHDVDETFTRTQQSTNAAFAPTPFTLNDVKN